MTRGLELELATVEDAAELAAMRTAVGAHLAYQFGESHGTAPVSEKSVLYALRISRVFVARSRGRIVATLRLATKKPWAIDKSYFTDCRRPLYLTDMAVVPSRQRKGIGRRCLYEARRIAREWPADAIRLDAYDAAEGAGGFYAKCGYREVGRAVYRKTPLIYYELLL